MGRRQLHDDEITEVRDKAREAIAEHGEGALDWGTKEFNVAPQTVCALLSRPPEAFEHTYEGSEGARLLEFHEAITLPSGDGEGFLTVRVETKPRSNEPEMILVDAVVTT